MRRGESDAVRIAVLLVEDEASVLEMVKLMLEESGYAVLASSAPSEAIGLVRENAADIRLLITDLVMPEMTGRDLMTRVTVLNPELKCLFMSGYSENVVTH